ncbi:MAG: MlaD family protein [Bacteroidales bacterium]|nr:MlaD family protein [Bacteroidales bacterium]
MSKLINKEVTIGAVTIVCAAILFFGIDYLKGINIFKPTNYYYIKYQDVTGLTVSGPVTLDGYKVGLVTSLDLDYNNPGTTIVEISLDKKLKVPAGSKAILATDLLGTASIQLSLNKYVSTYHNISDTLVGELNSGLMGKISNDILPALENILPRIDSIVYGLDQIINNSGLKETFQNINGVTSELEKSSKGLTKIMNNDIPVIMSNMKTISSNINEFSGNLKEINFDETITSINKTLAEVNQISQKMNSTDNTIGLLFNSTGIYDSLNSTINSADSLMVDLKAHPKRYVHFSVFGRK